MARERLGTLRGDAGRPVERVKIVRLGRESARVSRPGRRPGEWLGSESVPREQVLVDDGAAIEAASVRPKVATYVSFEGEPRGELKVVRVYAHSVRARLKSRNGWWSEPESFHPDTVRWDSGASWREHLAETTRRQLEELDAENPVESAVELPESELRQGPRGQRVGYLRVSTAEQNEARQRELVGECDRVFVEKMTARTRAVRPQLEACLAYLREGDELVVSSMDRLARSVVDLRDIVDRVTGKGASVRFLHESAVYAPGAKDARADLMLSLLGAFAEFERAIIRERQAEGIAIAKREGRYLGRPRALTDAQVEQARARITAGETAVAVAKGLGVGRTTLYRSLGR